MSNDKTKTKPKDDTQQVLNDHGVQDIIPPNDEYYTLELKRGNDTDINDIPDVQIVGNNPLDTVDTDIEGELIEKQEKLTSSNAGGPIKSNDIVNQNTDAGVVAGEPGHWGVDEDTG